MRKPSCVKIFVITFTLFIVAKCLLDAVDIPNSYLVYEFPLQFACKRDPDLSETIAYGHYDPTGKFKTLPFFQRATKWKELSKRPLCVAVQSSLDFSYNIVELLESWPGAVSLSLFAPGSEFILAIHYLKYLKMCYPQFEEQVSVHLAFPMDCVPTEEGLLKFNLTVDCSINAKDFLHILYRHVPHQSFSWNRDDKYSCNAFRNVAKDYCNTEYIIVPDIDIAFPTPDKNHSIIKQLETFLLSDKSTTLRTSPTSNKDVFIIPVYEKEKYNKDAIGNKTELLKHLRQKTVQVYHKESCPWCHNPTDYAKWEALNATSGVRIAYTIPDTFDHPYEPFYIAKRGAVRYDERFIGYGLDRDSQVYEMKFAGFNFHVLDNIFLIHSGFKKKRRPVDRSVSLDYNYRIFCDVFKKEIAAKYNVPQHKIKKCKTIDFELETVK